jgi:flagellar motor switch protein FliM
MPATLSPEEVKALMSAIQDGRVGAESGGPNRGPVAEYDLTSQDRIIRGQMPTLDAINEQIAQQLGIGLSGRTRVSLRVQSVSASLLKFADLTPLLAPPAAICVLDLGGGFGFGLAVLEPGVPEQLLAAALGDRRTRGPNDVKERGRELTIIEQVVLKRLLFVLTDAIGGAWQEVLPFRPEPIRIEVDPRMANIAPPSEVAIVSAFDISGGLEGRIQLILPYATVEPAKHRLSAPRRNSQRADDRIAQIMARELEQVRVDVRGILGCTRINLSRLLDLAPGEILMLDNEEGTPLPVVVQGRTKLHGTPTVSGGAISMRVEHALQPRSE